MLKATLALSRDGIEPDTFDDLSAELRAATDMARSMWCPAESRGRLVEFIRKCNELLAAQAAGSGSSSPG